MDDALRDLLLVNSDREEDTHIADLSWRVRALIKLAEEGRDGSKDGGVVETQKKAADVVGVAHGVEGSVNEQEETEKAIP